MASCGVNFKTILVMFCVFGALETLDHNQTVHLRDIMMSLNNFSQTFMFRAGEFDISPECIDALSLYGSGLASLDMWALQMLDAMSKVQSGVLAGNLYNLGAYEECQSIKDVAVGNAYPWQADQTTTLISGKYCLGSLVIPIGKNGESLPLMWAMCAPDACSAMDLNIMMTFASIPMGFDEILCHTPSDDPEITGGDIGLIASFGTIALIMLISSIYDLYLRYCEKKTLHPLLLAFSVVTNGEKLFAMRKSDGGGDQMGCLHGVRSLSMMWVLLGHMFTNFTMAPLENATAIGDFFMDGWTMYVRGATVSVDSFFLMSGILMIYVYLKSTKDKQCFNVPLYYLHRYLRLTPALAAVLVVHLTILKHFGAGPFWPVMVSSKGCEKYWWSLLLYVQNYVNPDEICLGHSWYLSVDTQLFFVSPLILVPLKRWPIFTLIVVLVAAIASISYGFAVSWIYKLRDVNSMALGGTTMADYMNKYYTATYARAAPWLIGIIVGYYIYKIKSGQRKFELNRYLNLALWACSLALLTLIVFYDIAQDDYNRLAHSFYIALNRPVWALALSWVIFACVTGYGGVVNDFLSLPVFQVLGRLAYSMYLTHFSTIMIILLSTKQSLHFSNARVMYEYWSMFVLIAVISVFWTLAFESPVIIIEKCIFGGAMRPQPAPPKAVDSRHFDGARNDAELEFSNEKSPNAEVHRRWRSDGVDNNGYSQ